LIIAIDAFNYFGELHSLLQTARNALEYDGRLIFTLEVGPADLPNGFSLELTGRYSHSVEYVLEWIVSAGFVVEKDLRFSIRQQAGKDVSASLLTLMPN
jgi:predicted TPR repeat methyltransferase